MIKVLHSYDDIIRAIRPIILKVSELPNDHLLNAFSVRGPELEKLITNTETGSYNLNDLFIIFELIPDTNTDNFVAAPDEDSAMELAVPYTMTLKLYGNLSNTSAYTLLGRLRSATVLQELQTAGIYLYKVNPPVQVTEFINNTVWPRNDLKLDFQVRFRVEPNEDIPELLYPDRILVHTFSGMESY